MENVEQPHEEMENEVDNANEAPAVVAFHNHEHHVNFANANMQQEAPQGQWHGNRGGDEIIEVVAEELPTRRNFYQHNDAMDFEDQSAAARGMEGFYEFVMAFLVWVATLVRGLLDYGTRGNYTKIFGGKVSVANGEVIVNQQVLKQNLKEDEERRNAQMARKAHTLNELREDLKNAARLMRLPHYSNKNGAMNTVLASRIQQKEATVKDLERVLAMGTTVDGMKERSQHTKEFLNLTTMNTKALRNNLKGLNDEVADRVREELETVQDDFKDIAHAMGSFDTKIMTLEDMGEEDIEKALQEYLDEEDWEPSGTARNTLPILSSEVQDMVFSPQAKITPLPAHIIQTLQNPQQYFAQFSQGQQQPPAQSNTAAASESTVTTLQPEFPRPGLSSLSAAETSSKSIIARVSASVGRDQDALLLATQNKTQKPSEGPTKIKIPLAAPKPELQASSTSTGAPEVAKPVNLKPKLKVLHN